MSIEIESGVPLVVNRRKYPFAKLEVGDSFAVSPEDHEIASLGRTEAMRRLRNSLVSSARSYSQRHGVNLFVRKFNVDTYRVWRVELVSGQTPHTGEGGE